MKYGARLKGAKCNLLLTIANNKRIEILALIDYASSVETIKLERERDSTVAAFLTIIPPQKRICSACPYDGRQSCA